MSSVTIHRKVWEREMYSGNKDLKRRKLDGSSRLTLFTSKLIARCQMKHHIYYAMARRCIRDLSDLRSKVKKK